MRLKAILDDSFFRQKPWWLPGKLHQVICNRANPRSTEYMTELLKKNYPDGEIINVEDLDQEVKNIILLYPDSIGLGWTKIETKIFKTTSSVQVLNGRGRNFALTPHLRVKLIIRRFLEITFLPELIITPFILILAGFLALIDKVSTRNEV